MDLCTVYRIAASAGILEEEYQDLDLALGDRNMYTLGEIGGTTLLWLAS
jgi:hypothetical protein